MAQKEVGVVIKIMALSIKETNMNLFMHLHKICGSIFIT